MSIKVSHKKLGELLHYDPESGSFWWKVCQPHRAYGARAGHICAENGYRVITINKKNYMEHRLVWFYTHKKWPSFTIHHVNGIRSDNRIHNLKDIPLVENLKYRLKGRAFSSATHKIPAWVSPKRDTELTPEIVRKLLTYDPKTGVLVWRFRRSNVPKGTIAGYINTHGYRVLSLAVGGIKKRYPAHRLIWLHVYGHLPDQWVDHVNGDKDDNRLSNLREATPAQNNANKRAGKDNTSGVKGVSFCRTRNKWAASICSNGHRRNLGRFKTKEEARIVYREAAKKYHREFARVA